MPQPFDQLPQSLRAHAREVRLAGGNVPALIVHPDPASNARVPFVLWLHGRTVSKELDPGRYLRWMRAGIGACAIDLPGHGARLEARLHEPEAAWEVLRSALDEIDAVTADLRSMEGVDAARLAIGGMSLGGMIALARLCTPHEFICTAVEATTGSWSAQRERAMFRERTEDELRELDPIRNLDGWREIPFLALHARRDEWVRYEGQAAFVEGLRSRYARPELVEFEVYEHTGAPAEHVGFGTKSVEAKNRQTGFLERWLLA